jgi:hypothetical protein
MGSSPKAPAAPEKSEAQKRSEARQEAEYASTDQEVNAKRKAMMRKKRGRSSLISGEETGIGKSGTLG